ncbi:class I SAM-dependent methyltransferase [Bacillus marasmi]|uniref:class I SAM-dependent methyltransferase n=1 Tax=Bacillus marasmi TaxID=1926279 RepID=UPI0011C72345|nr:class I SAM-dependent methyltransferase [Bacillus marasmi]
MKDFYWVEAAEKEWNTRANSWHSQSKEMWETGSRKDIVLFFKQYVNRGARVVDLGCGDGYGSYKLAKAGYAVTGIDVSEEMIEKANSLAQPNLLQFTKGDIAKIDVPDYHYDAVIAINSLEWTESPLQVLEEMKRVVKPGGKACVGILGPTAAPRENSYRRLYGAPVVCNTIMPWEFERLAEENGWRKTAELGVYKRDTEKLSKSSLTKEIRQALTFMTVFMLELD